MNEAEKRYYYEVKCYLGADGIGSDECTILMTKSQFKAFKKHAYDIRIKPCIHEPINYLDCDKFAIEGRYAANLVTERRYKKMKPIYHHEKSYSGDFLDELWDYLTEEERKKNREENQRDYQDTPYYKVEFRTNLGITTIALSNSEYLAFAKNCRPEITFNRHKRNQSEWFLLEYSVESWKEEFIWKESYETLRNAFHDSHCAKDLLERIESWVVIEEKEELEKYMRDNPESDNENEKKLKSKDASENEDDDEDEDVEEKPLEKKVKTN